MAGGTRLLAALIGLAISAAACSSDDQDIVLSDVTASSTTTEAPPPSVTTTLATTTTLSEQALAEAEIEQLVIDWWLAPYDTSKGELGLEYLTGLIALRGQEFAQHLAEEGQILRNQGQERIEVTNVEVDLEAGQGEVNACMGSSGEFLDAETMEQIGQPEDPDFLATGVLFVERTDEGWKISELIDSVADGDPELCEIEPQ